MGYARVQKIDGTRNRAGLKCNLDDPVSPTGPSSADTRAQQYKILIVDDEPVTLKQLELAFKAQNFDVWVAQSGSQALGTIQSLGLPHLVLVDYLMPGMTGLECATRLAQVSDVPFIVMSGRNDTDTVLKAFETAAEDFVAKPINVPVLMARVRRVLRQNGGFAPERLLRIDEHLKLELGRRKANVDGAAIRLSNSETKLLTLMIRNAPRVVRTEYIIDVLWPMAEVFDEAPLRALVYRTRRKIEPRPEQPRYLITERGLGYRFPSSRPSRA